MPINQYQRRIVTLDDLIPKMRAEKQRISDQIAQAREARIAAEEALAGELSERSRGAKTRELGSAVKALADAEQRLQVLEGKYVKAEKDKLRAQGQLKIAQERAAKKSARKSAAKGVKAAIVFRWALDRSALMVFESAVGTGCVGSHSCSAQACSGRSDGFERA